MKPAAPGEQNSSPLIVTKWSPSAVEQIKRGHWAALPRAPPPVAASLRARSAGSLGMPELSPARPRLAPMKWSRVAYYAVFMAVLTLFVTHGVSPWLTVPLGAFAAWWTYVCTDALW